MPRVPTCPSWARQVFNAFLCIASFAFIFTYFRRYVSLFPITCESIWQISLAEINRRKNVRRIRALEQKLGPIDEETGIKDKMETAVRHIASVVGYREEPNLFRKCLQSYRGSPGLELMLVGIDGDGEGDMEMVHIAEEVGLPSPQTSIIADYSP
jgi:hyaluronan synthase